MIGIQMACAYTGTTLMPPLFGWLAAGTRLSVFPQFLALFLLLMFLLVGRTAPPCGDPIC
jgi:hypothetical protein